MFSLAGIFSLRMFGLFMLLPVLSIYADGLTYTTPVLMGLALGSYGLTQALFQIPFGLISDRINRKHVIAFGLVVFALGSVVAGLSDSIYGLIIGRSIQGAGAISAATLALTADLTRSSQRTKAMAVIGICIGFSFMLALIVAPPIQSVIGVSGLFWLTAVFAVVAIFVVLRVVPDAHSSHHHDDIGPAAAQIRQSLSNFQLMQLNLGIFVSHAILTALFLVLPALLVSRGNYPLETHWKIYIPILLLSVVGMTPFIMAGSRVRLIRYAYQGAILLLLVSFVILVMSESRPIIWLLGGVVVFFSAFNALESLLPSMVSQIAPPDSKGTAIAIYNVFQFSGVFIGGLAGGWTYGEYGSNGVFLFCGGMITIWLLIGCVFSRFSLTGTRIIEMGHLNDSQRSDLIARIGTLNGIREVSIVDGETVAHLVVDELVYDDAEIKKLINIQRG